MHCRKIDTKDLALIAKCPKRWKKDLLWKEEPVNPRREALKQAVFTSVIKENSDSVIESVAYLWDSIFWQDKQYNRETIRQSTNGIIATLSLISKVKKNVDIYVPSKFTVCLDSTVFLASSADFVIFNKDENVIESWIFSKENLIEYIKSPIPLAETFLIQRFSWSKTPVKVIIFDPRKSGISIHVSKTREKIIPDERTIMSLIRLSQSNGYPSYGNHCKTCPVKCYDTK